MATKAEKEEQDKRYNLYIDERKSLVDAAREGARTFDKAILTLASGSYGLSIAFLKDVVPKPQSNTMIWLALAWILFSLSIITILISFIAGQKACEQRIINAYAELVNGEKNLKSCWATTAGVLNYISVALFTMAVGAYACFVYWNIVHQQ